MRFFVPIGQALAACGEPKEGLKWLRQVRVTDPPYDLARGHLARILQGIGEHEQVLKLTDCEDAATLSDPMAIARVRSLASMSRPEEAIELVNRIDALRGAQAKMLEAAADAAIARADWSLALEFITRAAAKSPEARFEFRRGVFLFHLDRFDESLEVLQPFMADPEFSVRANMYRFRIYHQLGNHEELLVSCENILHADAKNEFAIENLVKFNLELLNFDKVDYWFDYARGIFPDKYSPTLHNFLKYERQGKLRLAMLPFEGGELDGEMSDGTRERVANCYYFMGKFGRARGVARLVEDGPRRTILKAKISLADGGPDVVDGEHDGNEARVIRSLGSYRTGRFGECIAELDLANYPDKRRLPIDNFRFLAESGRLLSNDLFSKASSGIDPAGELPVIQQLWVGSELSYIEFLSIRSFLACGHQVHLYTYDENIAVPAGCVVRDAREIMPESDIFAHSHKTGRGNGSFAGFADLFRWKLVYEKGGAWADADVICLRPIRSTELVNTELVRLEGVMLPGITNCFFAAPKGEKAFLQAFESSRLVDRTELLWGEIGVHLMARIVAENGWGGRLADPSDICPIPPFRIVDAILGSFDPHHVVQSTNCRAVHLYNEVMRTVGMDKNGHFPKKGLIGYLERRVSEREASAGRAS